MARGRLSDTQFYDLLAVHFAGVLGPLEPRSLDSELREAMEHLGRRMVSPAWTNFPRRARALRKVKVRAGLFLHHWSSDSARGRIRAQFTSTDGKVLEVALREGDRDLPHWVAAGYIRESVDQLTKDLTAMAREDG